MNEPAKKIRVLLVDDSAVLRSLLRIALATCPEVDLVGVGADGIEGLEAIERLRPDLVLLDIEMPRMNGLEVLVQVQARHRQIKVIMCSTLTRRGAAITLEALAQGAADYVTKPASQNGVREGVETLCRELLPRIRALFPDFESKAGTKFLQQARSIVPRSRISAPRPEIVVIGVSTGGPAALERVLAPLPPNFPLPVLIVQHMPPLFTTLLAERLDGLCGIPVREAASGEVVQPGHVYLARGDWHMQLIGTPARCVLRLTQAAYEQSCRPSVDVLFRSAAAVFGSKVFAVVLTGMGSDGLNGCRAIHAAGGRILAQDRETSAVWGMPGAVAEARLAEQLLPPEALAEEIMRSATGFPSRKHA